jgi:FtsH-binding integral membrane protein
MAKWANYLIIGAVISMIVPFILDYLDLLNNHVFWPVLSIALISVGFVLHVFNGATKQKLNVQTLLVLSSILIIVLGFSLVQLNVKNSEYMLLLGTALIFVWLFLPNKRRQ